MWNAFIFSGGIAVIIFAILHRRARKKRAGVGDRIEAMPSVEETVPELRDRRRSFTGFAGALALFGCGHVQPLQPLANGVLIRHLLWEESWRHHCHACWFRTGESRRPERSRLN